MRQAYAMTRVLDGYFASRFAEEAQIPPEVLREYCVLMGDVLTPAGRLLQKLVEDDSFPYPHGITTEAQP